HGTDRAEPEQALLWITLTARADAPGPALANVSARGRTLVAMLDELQIREPDRTTTGVTVAEEIERLTNPEIIARLISRAAGELDARVDGPRWQIAPDNPVRLEAAREAARDAERKA